jgi:cation diffusion facilitator family transporter
MAGSSKKVVYFALAGNSLIAVTKFIAFGMTGSSAMMAEAIHSVVDSGNQLLLLFGIHRAKRPPDKRFPFGYGKEQYFWSFVVALLIFAVGSGIAMYEGIHALQDPKLPTNPNVNYIVLAFAVLFEGGALWAAVREFNKVKGQRGYIRAIQEGKDPALFTVLFEDSAAMLGLLVAGAGVAVGQFTGWPYADGIASLTIGVILAVVAVVLAFETKGLLIGEAAQSETVEGIEEMMLAEPGIEKINELLTMHIGPDFVLVTATVDFRDSVSAHDLELTVGRLDREIKASYPRVKRVFIEAESWTGRPQPARMALVTGQFGASASPPMLQEQE